MIFSNKIVDLKHFNPTLINYINDIVKNNAFVGTIIVLENTKGLTSEMVNLINKSSKLKFRIQGAYDTRRLEKKINKNNKKQIEEEYIDIVTYTREELYNILLIIERIEESTKKIDGILEKALFIYDSLRKYFGYKYYGINTSYKEENSLRLLLTKNISAKGLSLLYKELLDRQNINCHYVEGTLISDEYSTSHFWNIFEIDEKFMAIDLYLDIIEYRNGYKGTPLYFGDISSFIDSHIPNTNEIIQYYENSLTPISKQIIIDTLKNIALKNEKKHIAYSFTRTNGSKGLYSLIGEEKCEDILYKKLVYVDVINNSVSNPVLVYIDSNFKIENNNIYIDNHELSNEETQIFYDRILDPTNIRTGITLLNGYIGTIKYNTSLEFNIIEDNKYDIRNLQKNLVRTNGTTFVIEQININRNGEDLSIGIYKIYELIPYDNYNYVFENIIYTEKDIFSNKDSDLVDNVLSRTNIENAIKYRSGYLGYFNPAEIKLIEKKENNE